MQNVQHDKKTSRHRAIRLKHHETEAIDRDAKSLGVTFSEFVRIATKLLSHALALIKNPARK